MIRRGQHARIEEEFTIRNLGEEEDLVELEGTTLDMLRHTTLVVAPGLQSHVKGTY